MKIAVICPYAMDRPGGVQSNVRDLAAAQRAHGHSVTVIAPSGSEPHLAPFGARRQVMFNQTQFDLCAVWGAEKTRLEDWLAAQHFDILHFHAIWDPILPLQILARAGKAARIATFHDTPPGGFAGWATRQVFKTASRLLSPHLDAVTAVSASPARHLRLGPGRKLHIVPPCTDLSPFRAAAAARQPGTPCKILFLGRLDPRKGVHLLLDAYRSLIADGVAVTLTIAGGGAELGSVRERVARENLPGIEILGPVAETDKPALYAAADLFCAPSPFGESFGIVLTEAMASGLPVVAAANAGYGAVLAEKADDCLATPGDAAALAAKLRSLVDRPERRGELGRWGAEEALRYDCRAWVGPFDAIYREALERRYTGRYSP